MKTIYNRGGMVKKDIHHIYPKNKVKKKGKYPDWINSPLNMVEVEHYEHINRIHSASTNEKGIEAREQLFKELKERLDWQYVNGDITLQEKVVLDQVYYWCLIQCCNKAFKNMELLKAYEIVCENHKGE